MIRVVFGWYSFKIKTYAAEDLQLAIEHKEMSFEVRQKCFHLFWIPFFGIGKIYAIRKQGQLYQATEEVIPLIKAQGKHNAPWYSFTGLLLIPLIYLGALGVEAHDTYERTQSNARHIQAKREKIDHPTVNDFYVVYSNQPYKSQVLQVAGFTQDSVFLKLPTVEPTTYLSSARYMADFFEEIGASYQLVKTSKEKLKAALETDPADLAGFEGVVIPEVLGETKFDIDRIERLEQRPGQTPGGKKWIKSKVGQPLAF